MGEYLVKVDINPYSSEWIEFTMGNLTTASTADIVNVGGFIVPTDPCEVYNFTITLNNEYNVSVPMEVNIYDESYLSLWPATFTLGTWFDGSDQIPHPTQESSYEFTLNTRTWTQDHALILIATYPYNNTAGIGDDFENFAVDLTINWEKVTEDVFDNSNSDGIPLIDAGSSADAYNLTLEFPGSGSESYLVLLNTTPGTWYNISLMTGDVSSLSSIVTYSPYYDGTHAIPWNDLNDELQGSTGNWSIQFGAISEVYYMTINVNRALFDEGFLWIQATPLETHTFEAPTPLKASGPDILSMLGDAAIPIGIAAVVIVVVVVLYVKKFKK